MASAARCRACGNDGQTNVVEVVPGDDCQPQRVRHALLGSLAVGWPARTSSRSAARSPSAGLIRQTKLASPVAGVRRSDAPRPARRSTTSPGPPRPSCARTSGSTVPSTTSKRSVWYGWTCAAATVAPGCRAVSTTTYSPSVSRDVSRKVETLARHGVLDGLSCANHLSSLDHGVQLVVQSLRERAFRESEARLCLRGGRPVFCSSENRTRPLSFGSRWRRKHARFSTRPNRQAAADDRPAVAGRRRPEARQPGLPRPGGRGLAPGVLGGGGSSRRRDRPRPARPGGAERATPSRSWPRPASNGCSSISRSG